MESFRDAITAIISKLISALESRLAGDEAWAYKSLVKAKQILDRWVVLCAPSTTTEEAATITGYEAIEHDS